MKYYQGASLVNFNFNNFTRHYTLYNGYVWGYHLVLSIQQLLHLYSLHHDNSTAQRATHCNMHGSTSQTHFTLSSYTHSGNCTSRRLSTQSRTSTEQGAQVRKLNYISESTTVQSPQDLRQSQRDYWLKPHAVLQHQALPYELCYSSMDEQHFFS